MPGEGSEESEGRTGHEPTPTTGLDMSRGRGRRGTHTCSDERDGGAPFETPGLCRGAIEHACEAHGATDGVLDRGWLLSGLAAT